jgi:uncharacterized protein YciI
MLIEGPTPAEESVLAAHSLYVSRLAEHRIVILAGRTQNTDETSFGVVIFRADSPTEARGIMERDPAVRDGVLAARLFPYRIAVRESDGKREAT